MEGGEDVLAAAMAAVALASEQNIRTSEQNATMVARMVRMQATIDSLNAEKEALNVQQNVLVNERDQLIEELALKTEDNSNMEDRIAELDAIVASFRNNKEEIPDPVNPDTGTVLLKIPEWRIGYICNRITGGDRPTYCNMVYIAMYSDANRFLRADRFRKKIVDAFCAMCRSFPDQVGIPTDIPDDFGEVKRYLVNFATLNQREYMVKMFRAL
jgi:hypothetical protein